MSAPTCHFCQEPFRRERPAGEIAMTIPVGRETMTIRTPICMACLRRMMGESLERALNAAKDDGRE